MTPTRLLHLLLCMGLFLAVTSCDKAGKHSKADQTSVELGLDADYRKIRRIETFAECSGAAGMYTTEIQSFDDGYYYFYQKYVGRPGEFRAVMNDSAGYSIGRDDEILAKLQPANEAILRSHDFHRMVLFPGDFINDMQLKGSMRFQGRDSRVYSGTDPYGLPVDMVYDPADRIVHGYRMRNPVDTTAIVILGMKDWRETDYGRIPYHATVVQAGVDTFSFKYTSIAINDMGKKKVLLSGE